ncbi:MAG: helix-turn-helix domain-containing protein, partial [Rhodobacteraceae bacterium]|nr:helix-turn-helix domain-containing protein [Paracoccaceae bacterium]
MTTSRRQATQDTVQDTPNYGPVIRQRRKALGMTLDDVAKATDLTIGFLSQVERGISAPSLSSFMRIAGALQTSLEELLKVPEPYMEYVPKDSRQTY